MYKAWVISLKYSMVYGPQVKLALPGSCSCVQKFFEESKASGGHYGQTLNKPGFINIFFN